MGSNKHILSGTYLEAYNQASKKDVNNNLRPFPIGSDNYYSEFNLELFNYLHDRQTYNHKISPDWIADTVNQLSKRLHEKYFPFQEERNIFALSNATYVAFYAPVFDKENRLICHELIVTTSFDKGLMSDELSQFFIENKCGVIDDKHISITLMKIKIKFGHFDWFSELFETYVKYTLVVELGKIRLISKDMLKQIALKLNYNVIKYYLCKVVIALC